MIVIQPFWAIDANHDRSIAIEWQLCAASVSIDFPSNSRWDAPFYQTVYDYSCVDLDGLHDHLRDTPQKDIFKLGASDAGTEFCDC